LYLLVIKLASFHVLDSAFAATQDRMYAAFDRNSPSTLTGDVLSLSWKGDGRQGWLASGNSRKTVGVTYTEMRDEEEVDCDLFDVPDVSLERQAMRRNFNFREHTHEVSWRRCDACLILS